MGLAERIHEDAVVAGQATAKYRSRGVPSDWYVDPADPDAADRYNEHTQDSLQEAATAFLAAHDGKGQWLFKGRNLTAFSNQEETQASFAGNAPWLLEDRLRLAGANYVSKPAWTPHVVTDGNLITGQQSTSAQVTADAVMKMLKVAV